MVRLVVSVLVAMAAVSLLGAAFVFWRVDRTLNSQLSQDLRAYRAVGLQAVETGAPIPVVASFGYQIVDAAGHLLYGDIRGEVAPPVRVMRAFRSGGEFGETGGIFNAPSYVWSVTPATYLGQRVVVIFAVNRHDHDEALRELLLQLALVGVATLLVAAWIGRRTARAALDPVERYRRAAMDAAPGTRLPVDDRDDELSRLGHTFNDLLDRLESSQERERRFLADASHELRAPLSLMRAEVEVALMRSTAETDPEHVEALTSLTAQIDRLTRLCTALLEWEELRGADQAALETVLLEEVLGEVAARARRLPAAAERVIVVDAAPDLRLQVQRHWIEVALSNLISNGLRYGSGTITVAAAGFGDSGEVEVWVADEGPGIPIDFLPRAFERFALMDQSRASGGTGLGLAIVAEVATLHAARIVVDGSRVSMLFPAQQEVGR